MGGLFRDLLQWSHAVVRKWVALVAGTAFALLSLVGDLGSVPRWVVWITASAFFFVAFFLAWRDMRNERDVIANDRDVLSAEKADRLRPRLRLTTALEWLQGPVGSPPDRFYAPFCYFWVTVHNDGPGGDWQAEFRNVVGIPSGEYSPHVAWENTLQESQYIARHGNQRLKLATYGLHVATHEPGFWFWMPSSASWAPGTHSLNPQPVSSDVVACDLRLHDRKSGHTIDYHVVLAGLRGSSQTIAVDEGTVVDA